MLDSTWGLHPLVVVRVDADLVLLEVEGILAGLDGAHLVVAVEIRPSPQTAVHHMGKGLSMGHLKAPIQRSGDDLKNEKNKHLQHTDDNAYTLKLYITP